MKLISELIKLILAGAFFLCLLDMPYGFYELIRFSAFAGFGYLAILEFQKRNTNGLIIYVVLALLFQPFIKVALERELWNIIDVSVAIGLIINTIYTFYKNPRNKSMSIKNIDKRILAREFLFTLGYLISISLIYVIVIFADDNNESQLRKLRKKIISLELPSESFINDAYNLGSYSIYSWDDNPRRTFKEFQTEASYNWQLVSKLYREYQKSYEEENGWREFSLSREKFNNLIGYRFGRLGENNKMNEKLQELYSYIKSKGVTDLTIEQFAEVYGNDPYKAKDVYDFVKSESMTDLNEADFFNAYFGEVKKTEPPVINLMSKEEIEQLLKDYIATVNNPIYKGNMNVINSKFPEFQGIDVQVLEEYISTYNNPDYSGNYAIINEKFPEFFSGLTNEPTPQEETKLKKLDAEILSRVERAGDPYRNYLWDLSVGILAIVFGMRYLIYATLWSLKQIRK
jgi:hypothetical protein